MPSPLRAICLLILTLFLPSALQATEGTKEGWETAHPGWRYEFPRDHGPHRKFKTEWWYATGTLTDEQGREYGFQLTFFRQGVRPGEKPANASRFRVMDLPFAHFALTDVSGKTFRHFQRSSRGAFGEAGFGVPPDKMAWMEDWEIAEDQQGRFHLKAADGDGSEKRSIDLILAQDRPPLLHGSEGISPKSSKPGHASHYYSLTRLAASGTVTVGAKVHRVKGLVWFDHEWATNSLDPGEAGWDWSGLHLSNGDDLMLFRIRDSAGNSVFLSGTLRDAKGAVSDIRDLTMTPKGTWKSPHTGGLYPAGFEISIPSHSLDLTLSPKMTDQELVLSPFAYWEGAVKGAGKKGEAPISAEGYLELTGYGGKVIGVNGQ